MDMNFTVNTSIHPHYSKPVPGKDLIIDSKQIRAILALGTRGEVPVPEQKHEVDILV